MSLPKEDKSIVQETSGVKLILVNRLVDKVEKKEKQSSLISKIKGIDKPSQGLKQQINTVVQRIEVQKHK